jgi:uncharacterized membrane protein
LSPAPDPDYPVLGRIVERRRIMAELRRSERAGSRRGPLRPGVLIGVGVPATLDEVVLHQHKLLGFHQVREGVPDNVPDDAAFVGLARLVLLAGVAVLRGSREVAARDARGPGRC